MTTDNLPPCRCCGGTPYFALSEKCLSLGPGLFFITAMGRCNTCGAEVETLDGFATNDEQIKMKAHAILKQARILWTKRNEQFNPFIKSS